MNENNPINILTQSAPNLNQQFTQERDERKPKLKFKIKINDKMKKDQILSSQQATSQEFYNTS